MSGCPNRAEGIFCSKASILAAAVVVFAAVVVWPLECAGLGEQSPCRCFVMTSFPWPMESRTTGNVRSFGLFRSYDLTRFDDSN